MPCVTVLQETPSQHGWEYRVLIEHADGSAFAIAGPTAHAVTLSFADHDYWSGGSVAPSRLIAQVLEYATEHLRVPLPRRFDAAKVRRWLPQLDSHLRRSGNAPESA
jgi:hypothetical protein